MEIDITKIAKDIINIKLTERTTLKQAEAKFYEVMRKYGIKMGQLSENGIGLICNNPEWTMCEALFRDILIDWFQYRTVTKVPKDLHHY